MSAARVFEVGTKILVDEPHLADFIAMVQRYNTLFCGVRELDAQEKLKRLGLQ